MLYPSKAAGNVLRAELSTSPFTQSKPMTAAQKLGLKFEARVLLDFELKIENFTSHPAFKFRSAGFPYDQYAIPDGIAWSSDRSIATLIECKLRHSEDGEFQLLKRYLPIIRKIYPSVECFNLLEVTSSFDPSVRHTRVIEQVRDPAAWVQSYHPGLLGIHIWL